MRDLTTETTKLVSAGGASCAPACGNGAFSASLRGMRPMPTSPPPSRFRAPTPTPPWTSTRETSAMERHRWSPRAASAACRPAATAARCLYSRAVRKTVPVKSRPQTSSSSVPTKTPRRTSTPATRPPARRSWSPAAKPGPRPPASRRPPATGPTSSSTTAEPLAAEDEDEANDVYEWSGGKLSLASPAPCASE